MRGIEESKIVLSVDRGINLDTVPAHVQATTERVFGEPLTPQRTVEKILASVKSEGDSAIRRLAKAIEGAAAQPRAARPGRVRGRQSRDQIQLRCCRSVGHRRP